MVYGLGLTQSTTSAQRLPVHDGTGWHRLSATGGSIKAQVPSHLHGFPTRLPIKASRGHGCVLMLYILQSIDVMVSTIAIDLMPLGTLINKYQTLTIVIDRDFFAPQAENLEFMEGGYWDSSLFFGPDPLIIHSTSIIKSNRVPIYHRLSEGSTKVIRLMWCGLMIHVQQKHRSGA